jgi:Gpi18-like mannosyltransferase
MIRINNLIQKRTALTHSIKEHKDVLIIVAGTIVITYFFIYVAYILAKNNFPQSFLGFWNIYDACHYENIAKLGYGTSDVRRVLIAFFPLYPGLMKLFSFVFRDYIVSGLIISNIAYACAALYLYKLVCIESTKDTALRAVMYFSIFPTAYFMHGVYTESLFLALVISCFYYARKERWMIAGILGAFLSATRLSGVIIILSLILEYLHQKNWKIKNIKKDIFWIALVPAGLGSYLVINYFIFSHHFQFLALQKEVWHKTLSFPFEGFWGAFKSVGWKDPTQIITSALSEIVFTTFVFGLIIWMVFKYRPLYTSYAWLTWLFVTSNSYWLSLPRYMLPIFPIFIIMAKWGKNKAVHYCILLFSILFYGTFVARYTQRLWTF